jgi:xanthine dehydrogenase molybdenum-binding subunit
VGTYHPKIDAWEKARGSVEFFDDVTLPGRIPRMIYAKIFASPCCNARIARLDTSKVEAYPGVYAVLRYDDPEVRAIPQTTHVWTDTAINPAHRDVIIRYFDRWALGDTARWVGDQIGFAVAAESEEACDEAMKLAEIEWEVYSKPFLNVDDCLAEDAFVLHPEIHAGSNRKPRYKGFKEYEITDEPTFHRGDVDKALAEAEVVARVEKTAGGQSTHGVLDFRGVVVDWSPRKMTVWTNHYFNEQTRLYLSHHLAYPMNQIRVLNGHVGAHMGRFNNGEDMYFLVTALLSKKAGRPVKYRMNLHEDFHDARNLCVFRITVGGSRDGSISALDIYGIGDSGAYHGADTCPLQVIADAAAERMLGPVPNYRVNSRMHYTNRMPGAVVRSVGNMQFNFAMAQAIDVFAEKIGMDPVEVIAKNGGNPWNAHPNESLAAVLKTGAEQFGWSCRHAPGAGELLDGTKRRGMGVAFYNQWHVEWQETERGQIEVEARVTPDLKLILNAPTAETGAGGNTAAVLACTEQMGFLNLTPDDVVWINHGDTEMGLRDVHASDSIVSFLFAELMPELAQKVKAEFIRRAMPRFGSDVRAHELDVAGAKVFVKGDPSHFVHCKDVMDDDCTCVKAYVQRGNNRNVSGIPYGAWFVEVEVDVELGTVEVLRITIVNDVGQVMHASGAESQQIGGQLLAVSESLFEELNYDPGTGTMLSPNFIDYRIALMPDFPKVSPILKEVWRGAGEYGAAGLAEGTTTGTYAAVANAVYNAVGVRVDSLPIKPEQLLVKLAEKAGQEGA